MKEIYEMDVYKLAEELSDLIWYAFRLLQKKRSIDIQKLLTHLVQN